MDSLNEMIKNTNNSFLFFALESTHFLNLSDAMRMVFIFSTTDVDVRFTVVSGSGGAGGNIRTCALQQQLSYDG